MDDQALTAAVERVVEARLGRSRLARIETLASLDDGYIVQHRANERLEPRLGARVGHKIGGTTEAMRRYIHAPEPLGGEIFASQVHPDGATIRRAEHVRLGIETEIAVRLGHALPARTETYSRDEIAGAVAEMMAAIELVDDRYVDFTSVGAPTLVADNAFDAGSVLGTPVASWRGLDLAGLTARTFRDGIPVAEGRSDALLGHPLDALAWLANCRSRQGLGLAAGSFVSLGTITPVQWVAAASAWRIEVEALGAVSVTVA
jgi:2-keto-4-pentenoate hydratase